ncbi:MAG: 50S ribosomal protein L9 [Chromatiales bacterium]|nr:50S ribosomal protein L9 [Chromatiales bacterium]
MEVILLQRVENLGGLGDKVKVRSGYGRNFLIPSGRAVPATAANLADFEARRAELERQEAQDRASAEARKASLEGKVISLVRKAGDEGKLFGSVGTSDIADAIVEAGVNVDRREVRMSEGPLRTTGEFEVELHLYTDVDVIVAVHIVAE